MKTSTVPPGNQSTSYSASKIPPPNDSRKKTQRAQILRLLIEARGAWVSLPRILETGAAQYNTRIHELRGQGFLIENRRDGVRSWFRLVSSVPTSKLGTVPNSLEPRPPGPVVEDQAPQPGLFDQEVSR
jgi:hypothetical protein